MQRGKETGSVGNAEACAVVYAYVAVGKNDNNAMRIPKGIGFQNDIASFK